MGLAVATAQHGPGFAGPREEAGKRFLLSQLGHRRDLANVSRETSKMDVLTGLGDDSEPQQHSTPIAGFLLVLPNRVVLKCPETGIAAPNSSILPRTPTPQSPTVRNHLISKTPQSKAELLF